MGEEISVKGHTGYCCDRPQRARNMPEVCSTLCRDEPLEFATSLQHTVLR